jgi:hypothetical protein
VNQLGVAYQKDLGAATGKVAAAITQFNTGSTWTKAADQSNLRLGLALLCLLPACLLAGDVKTDFDPKTDYRA